jgi:diguanylate cyclase (GGDEF)-like protein
MTRRATVMIVDDEVSNIEILNAALDDEYEICFATSGEEAIRIARAAKPDLILLDVLMPGIDGYEVCRRLKDDPSLADIPVIFATGLGDQQAEIRGLSLGAIDYVTKPISPPIVRLRIHNHLELKRMRDTLAELTMIDALTGVANRRRLDEVLKLETARLARTGSCLSVIMLDIDCFKSFNDAYGHPAGDHCIALVAGAMSATVRRAADLTARYGGEEFACVLPEIGHEGAMVVANVIRERVRSLNILHERSSADTCVTVSIGVATANSLRGMLPEHWLQAADRQLYLAKEAGRNRVVGDTFECRSDHPNMSGEVGPLTICTAGSTQGHARPPHAFLDGSPELLVPALPASGETRIPSMS